MYTDNNDKVIAFHPNASATINGWLYEIEKACQHDPAAVSRVRAITQILSTGFGHAARVTPDTPDGSLFVIEYTDTDTDHATYVFGCVHHHDDLIGVHS